MRQEKRPGLTNGPGSPPLPFRLSVTFLCGLLNPPIGARGGNVLRLARSDGAYTGIGSILLVLTCYNDRNACRPRDRSVRR